MMEQLLLSHPDAQHTRTQWVCIPLWSRTVLTTVGRITDPVLIVTYESHVHQHQFWVLCLNCRHEIILVLRYIDHRV